MEIIKKINDTELTITLTGRLDATTSPEFEETVKTSLNGVTKLIIDMASLDYVSSAGLRVVLATHKKMLPQGEMIIQNVGPTVMEIFDVTGFSDILTIE